MNKIIRYWNENRGKIILGIVIIASIIIIVQLFNYFAKMQNMKKNSNNIVQEETSQLPMQSIITGENIDKETTQTNVELIDKFITYCNEANTTKAYEMLTEECKETFFTSEEEFIQNYYNLIFTQKRLYGIENFRNSSNYYTYEVKFYQDALSSGKLENTNVYQDYITVNEEQGKININSFIKKQKINKTVEKDDIQITIYEKEIYKDYEKYNISVTNNTNKTILLDSKKSTQNIYGIGNDNGKYQVLIHEIATSTLEIRKENTRNYTFKVNKIYNPSVTINTICFQDIITDKQAYEKGENIESLSITVDL